MLDPKIFFDLWVVLNEVADQLFNTFPDQFSQFCMEDEMRWAHLETTQEIDLTNELDDDGFIPF